MTTCVAYHRPNWSYQLRGWTFKMWKTWTKYHSPWKAEIFEVKIKHTWFTWVLYFKEELNIYIRYLRNKDACRILSRVTVFSLVLLNTPAQQNVISSLGRKPLPKFFTQVPSHAVKIPICFLRLSASHMNNLNHHHENIINLERNPRKLKP